MAARSALAILETHVDQGEPVNLYDDPLAITEAPPTLPVIALAVASDKNRSQLTKILRGLNVDIWAHESLRALRRCLLQEEVDLVVTDVTLPDGNWVDVLRFTIQVSPRPGILVHSRVVSDRLWSEVLWRGAYDMLISPYSPENARRIIEGALRAGSLLDGPRLVS